jgi:mannose-1-phosphate guanylyltransferase / mannose-6-phosphate isomerase
VKVVILAGGIGSRLWPISKSSFPKQFLKLYGDYSLLQNTVRRFSDDNLFEDLIIVTNASYSDLVKKQVSSIDKRFADHILVEPEGKNTAPAIALAVKYMQENFLIKEDECFFVTSSDHFIYPEIKLIHAIESAEEIAKQGNIVVFGVHPNKPETGYGYIEMSENILSNNIYEVKRFVEKPSFETAQKYLLSGNFLWNAGLFLFQMKTFLDQLEKHQKEIFSFFEKSYEDFLNSFSSLPNISIDYGLLEKSEKIAVSPLNLVWSDVGSWDNVYETMEKDENMNVKKGNVVDLDTKNCLIISHKKLISTIGIEDMIIIETEDAILLSKKGSSQKVKLLLELIKKQKANKK